MLETYVLDVLFNPTNPEGARFRGECLAWHDAAGCRVLRAELLREARAWLPDSWDCTDGDDGETVFAGRLGHLQATLVFPRDGEPVAAIFLE